MMNFKSYEIKRLRGVDDLKNEYAYVGNSQGDEFCTNDVKEGQAQGSWATFKFTGIDPLDQEAIYSEALKRKQENDEYIAKLKSEGRYEEPYNIKIHFIDYNIFDK